VFTGGEAGDVYLWDLRNMDAGYLCKYKTKKDNPPDCLAIEPRFGTLLGGGAGGITCWDLKTGTSWLELP
jgi:WD40 repeat protein